MKKIKIMLTAITVFAVVGGALAFKAQKFGAIVYTTNNPVEGATCPFELREFTITDVKPNSSAVLTSVTDIQSAPCVESYTKPQD
jgi:hypothetical protein